MLNQSAKRNRFLASVTNRVGKQKFICLIGGAGYKPAPQLGRQTAFYRCEFVKKWRMSQIYK